MASPHCVELVVGHNTAHDDRTIPSTHYDVAYSPSAPSPICSKSINRMGYLRKPLATLLPGFAVVTDLKAIIG
jgi:hypothetical protein